MHGIATYREALNDLQAEFEKEYGTFDINIQTGVINYQEENGQANS